MSVLRGIINIGIGIVALLLSMVALKNYFGGGEAKIKQYEQLIAEGEKTMAVFDSVYTEISIKGITSYSTKYFFYVDKERYEGKYSFDSPSDLSDLLIEVSYMKNDPTINEVELEEKLSKALKDRESNFDLWFGLIALFLGGLFIFIGYRKIAAYRLEQQQLKKQKQEFFDRINRDDSSSPYV